VSHYIDVAEHHSENVNSKRRESTSEITEPASRPTCWCIMLQCFVRYSHIFCSTNNAKHYDVARICWFDIGGNSWYGCWNRCSYYRII